MLRNSVLRCWLGKMTQKWHQSVAERSPVALQTLWAERTKWRWPLKCPQRDYQHRNTQTNSFKCLGRSSATCQAWSNPVWETSSVTGTYLCCRARRESIFFLLKIFPSPLQNDKSITMPDLFFVLTHAVEILQNWHLISRCCCFAS